MGRRQAILYRGEDGQWVAEVPSLPGCVSQGPTRDDALRAIAEAATLWIESVKALGRPIPPDDMSASIEFIPVPAA